MIDAPSWQVKIRVLASSYVVSLPVIRQLGRRISSCFICCRLGQFEPRYHDPRLSFQHGHDTPTHSDTNPTVGDLTRPRSCHRRPCPCSAPGLVMGSSGQTLAHLPPGTCSLLPGLWHMAQSLRPLPSILHAPALLHIDTWLARKQSASLTACRGKTL
jgi:hypothetical protein